MICSVFQSGTSITRNIFPWHEWYPSDWVEITNLNVNPGDLISMLICTPEGAGSTTAMIYFGNQTSGLATSYEITAPSGTKLVGNSAEWIVETPIVNGQLTQMPDYGEVFFSVCEGYLGNGSVVNGGTGNNINLVQSGGVIKLNGQTQTANTVIDSGNSLAGRLGSGNAGIAAITLPGISAPFVDFCTSGSARGANSAPPKPSEA